MIDFENEIYTKVATALRNEYENINVTAVYQNVPAIFPSVSIIQESNTIATRYIDSGGIENVVDVMYEVNVYVNSKNNKKSLCKEIFSVVSDSFVGLGFERILAQPIPNEDESIYRMVGRFVAKIDTNKKISRR